MRLRNVFLATALTVTMTSAPVLAQAAESAPVSRSGAEMTDASELQGGWVIPLLALLAVIAGILAATSSGDDDAPTSP